MTELLNRVSKVNPDRTYSANYWAPLQDFQEDEDNNENSAQHATVDNLSDAEVTNDLRLTILAWINQRMARGKPFQKTPSTMILDSGTTSHFVRAEEKLPITGMLSKNVRLPDGSSIQATHITLLPFESLDISARKADILPGLRTNSLVSVGKLADAGYTTIFHPRGKGVTVHKKNTVRLKLHCKPVLQGWRDTNGLWRLSKEIAAKPKDEGTTAKQSNMEIRPPGRGLTSIKG
jgi:hypothetical protein